MTTAPGPEPDGYSPSREILRLAVPAFLALVAEPLFLLTDAAIVGHLGTAPLAGLGVAAAVLSTAAGIFVFLAYGTTAVVARQVGAGSTRGALEAGIAGAWLAVGLGVVTGLVVGFAAESLCRAFGASPEVLAQATTYLRVSAVGLPGMLIMMATTGVLRGLQDTRTPLVVAVAGFGANIVLNLVLVFGFGLGIAGSALGTVIAQTAMGLALLVVLVRAARRAGAGLRPHPARVLRSAVDGVPLLVRTLALRAIGLLTTWVAAGLGDVPLAAWQVSMTVWTFLVFTLDALAIAAQALTGKALGAADVEGARAATRLMVRWGVWGGAALGVVLLALSPVLPVLFSPEADVRSAVTAGLVVVALGQPLAGYVFVIDGVLIGAGDGRWLAGAMLLTLVLYAPVVLVVRANDRALLTGSDPAAAQGAAVAWLWAAFTAFMVIRGVTLWWRLRSDDWLVTGATR